jgi:alginate biosynthesis protein AlgX
MKTVVFCLFVLGFAWAQTITVCDAAREPLPSTGPLVAGLDGWLFRKSDLRLDPDLEAAIPYLVQIQQMLKARGTELIILPTPMRSVVYSQYLDMTDEFAKGFDAEAAKQAYINFLAELNKSNILAVDALSIAQNMSNDAESIDYFFKRDNHWTPLGARYTAEAIAELLQASTGYQDLAKKEFISKKIETQDFDGSLMRAIEDTCQTDIAPELLDYYETASAQSSGLFGDEVAPVVYIGTSFGNKQFNFAGFLSEVLQVDVLNYSIGGGGPMTAIGAYLLSKDYQTTKPAFLIWEFPFHNPPSDVAELRQIIPSIAGKCNNEVTQGAVIGNQVNKIWQGSEQMDYVVLESDTPEFINFKMLFEFSDGSKDEVAFDRSTRAENVRVFYTLLPKEDVAVTELKIQSEVASNIKIELCRF